MIQLKKIALPDFGTERTCPEIPIEVYQARLAAAGERAARAGLDALVVYGDREHFANMAHLTGFDPRFEESLLVLGGDGRRTLVVGNECMGYLPDERLGLRVELFQDFSLMGQPRDRSRPLRRILKDAGIGGGKKVGCVGWKTYSDSGSSRPRAGADHAKPARGKMPLGRMGETPMPRGETACDAPSYIVDTLRELTGDGGNVVNAAAIFTDPASGLRTVCEPQQIARLEVASTWTSRGVLALLKRIKPGVMELELQKHLDSRGLTLSCHPMIGFGPKARRGLASPSSNRAALGDAFTVAFGVAGALTCRAGCVARGPRDLPAATRGFYAAFAANYFAVAAAWYESLRVGSTAGSVCDAAQEARDGDLYDFALNPGHYLQLDEWVHSPFVCGSGTELRSGVAIQMDIIPVSKGPFFYINAEDGVVLADEPLRRELAEKHPSCWRRMQGRRRFMIETLGIGLDESVLPLSNMPAYLPPYAMALDRAMVKVKRSM